MQVTRYGDSESCGKEGQQATEVSPLFFGVRKPREVRPILVGTKAAAELMKTLLYFGTQKLRGKETHILGAQKQKRVKRQKAEKRFRDYKAELRDV